MKNEANGAATNDKEIATMAGASPQFISAVLSLFYAVLNRRPLLSQGW